jgi:O-antigen/teichoic acid export membrane protein
MRLKRSLQVVPSNTRWMLGDRLVSIPLLVFAMGIVARYLGPEQFGQLSFALSIVTVFSPIVGLGLNRILMRELVKGPDEAPRLVGTAFVLRLITALIAFLLLVAGSPYLGHIVPAVLLVVVGLQLFGEPLLTFYEYAQARERVRGCILNALCGRILSVGLRVLMVLFHAPLTVFGAGQASERILPSIGYGFVQFYRFRKFDEYFSFDKNAAKQFLGEAWLVVLAGLAFFLYQRIDQIMIGSLSSSRELGLYSLSARLYEPVVSVFSLIALSVYPRLTKSYFECRSDYWSEFRLYSSLFSLCGILLLTGSLVLGRPVLFLLFGSSFLDTFPILMVHMASCWLMLNAAFRSGHINTIQGNKYLMLGNFAGVLLNLVLNMVAIPRYGAMGAAVTSLLSQYGSLYVFNLFFPGLRPLFLELHATLVPVFQITRFFNRR